MLIKNHTYEVKIENYGCNGEGIGRVDNFPVFIEGALCGEEVKFLAVKVLKSFAYGKLLEVLTPSEHRKEVLCPVFKRCGGCQLLHMDYAEQLALKKEIVIDCMRKFSGLKTFEVADVCGLENEAFHYRNKAQYPTVNGKYGFYAPRSHDLIPVSGCLMQNKKDEKLIKIMENYPYPDEIRHLYTRYGNNEQMAVVITRTNNLKGEKWLVERMQEAGVNTLVQNINLKETNVILGEKNKILYGKGTVDGKIGDLLFEVSPHSFFQINAKQTERLYQKGKDLLDLNGTETLMDLYCGIGSIGLFMADKAKSVLGVECVPQAIENAKQNAKRNGIKNAEFIVGLSEDVFAEKTKEGTLPDVVIIDPPRKGCDEKLLNTLLKYSPEKILYISCNPATLARDLSVLSKSYSISTVYPYDLFPNTKHIECVVKLTKTSLFN